MQRTLVILKPDALQRGRVGQILDRFEQKGLQIVAMKMLQLSDARARRLYSVHKGKDFYPALIRFILSGPIVATVLQGRDAINVTRCLLGTTNGPEAEPGTIRGDMGLSRRLNLVHGSDSPESAKREIAILFRAAEICDYDQHEAGWLYGEGEI